MSKRILLDALKYVLAFGLLGVIIWRNWGEPDDGKGLAYVWQRHAVQGFPVDLTAFGLALTCFAAAVLLTFIRWFFLVRAAGLPFRLADGLRLGMIGMFFSTFLPGSIGGDVVKAVFIAREQSRRTVAVATVIIDRAIALWGLFWFVAVIGGVAWAAGFLQGEAERALTSIVVGAAAIVAASAVIWVVLGLLPAQRADRFAGRLERLPKVGHAAAEFWRAVWTYRQQPRVVALAMLIALAGHIGFVLTFHFASRVLWDGAQHVPSALEHFLIVPIGMVIQAVPVFPGGAGIGELGFGGLYKLLKCEMASGVLGSLVQRVIMWILGLAGLFVYMRMRPALKPAARKPMPVAVPA